MNAADQRKLTPILAALTVALGACVLLLAAGIGRDAHWDPAATLPPLPVASVANQPPPSKPLQQFALVWQKPLFNPDRQPLARATDGRSSIGDFTLTGVIMTPTLRMALLHNRNGDKELRVHEGQASADGGMTLVEIRARSAIFDSPVGRVELLLPSGAPIQARTPDTATAGLNQGPPTDSRAMAATNPPEAAATPDGRMNDSRAMAMQPPDEVQRTPQGAAPPQAVTTRQPPAQPAPTSTTARVRETAKQRRAAQAAAPREGVH